MLFLNILQSSLRRWKRNFARKFIIIVSRYFLNVADYYFMSKIQYFALVSICLGTLYNSRRRKIFYIYFCRTMAISVALLLLSHSFSWKIIWNLFLRYYEGDPRKRAIEMLGLHPFSNQPYSNQPYTHNKYITINNRNNWITLLMKAYLHSYPQRKSYSSWNFFPFCFIVKEK